jgi:peptidoglycan/xylan/chitin deacetylase (PgdA/CDA1 family)
MFWIVAAIVAVIALAHTAPFPFLLEYVGPGRSVWHMPASNGAPTIYLTYDDGPNPTATPQLLDVLARERATATFFLIPKHVTSETAPIVRRIRDEGHAIALHSHTRSMMMKGPKTLADLLAAQSASIAKAAGGDPCPLFRPHAGWRSWAMYRGLDRDGYTLTGWSFGMWDFNWYRPSKPEKLADRLVSKASDGDIIVMHDGHHENPRADRRGTVDATARLIPMLRAKGFEFGRICRPFAREAIESSRTSQQP